MRNALALEKREGEQKTIKGTCSAFFNALFSSLYGGPSSKQSSHIPNFEWIFAVVFKQTAASWLDNKKLTGMKIAEATKYAADSTRWRSFVKTTPANAMWLKEDGMYKWYSKPFPSLFFNQTLSTPIKFHHHSYYIILT